MWLKIFLFHRMCIDGINTFKMELLFATATTQCPNLGWIRRQYVVVERKNEIAKTRSDLVFIDNRLVYGYETMVVILSP